MVKKILTIICLSCIVALGLGGSVSFAGEMELLLNKLVEKKILTNTEAQQIHLETQQEMKEETKKVVMQEKKNILPEWVQKIKLKGDFRLRYQYDHKQGVADKDRARIRLRLGLESNINEKMKLAVGLATGQNTDDVSNKDASRSPNWTLGDGWAKKKINLDYAYAQYAPWSWIEMSGGKFNNPLWCPWDEIWDTDINPEGASFKIEKSINSDLGFFMNSGVFFIQESSSEGNSGGPMLYTAQAGLNYKGSDKIGLKGAIGYTDASNVKGKTLDGTVGTNSKDGNSHLIYDYGWLTPALEVTIQEPFKALGLDVAQFQLIGEGIYNTLISDNNTGFAVGFKMGDSKIATFGNWSMKYLFVGLEKDAVLDILPDSDRYGGKTGIRSHEVEFQYGLGKNTFLGVDIYRSWAISTTKTPETVVQVDWNLKF